MGQVAPIEQLFRDKWGRVLATLVGYFGGSDGKTADLLDHLLDESRPAFEFPISVDRTRMVESQEVWVYVNVAAPPPPDQQATLLEGLTPCRSHVAEQ